MEGAIPGSGSSPNGLQGPSLSHPLLVSVIEGDVMSPDFIPSQPEGVFLYPFCIIFSPHWGLGLPWWDWGFPNLASILLYLASDTANTGSLKR